MSRQSELELDESLSTLDWVVSSLSASSFYSMSTRVVCQNQLPLNNLPQDVIAAGEEIDSIVSELWRAAVRSESDSPKNNILQNDVQSPSQCQPNEILLSVLKGKICDGPVADVSTSQHCIEREIALSSLSVTETHVRNKNETHLKTKSKYNCDRCEKSYIWLNDLVKHQKSHLGEVFSCYVCEKSYSLKSDLSKHQRVHNSIRPILCKDCGKSFFSMGDFHKHVRIHTGERPYNCKICKKSFSASDNYHKHVRTHSGEKPLSCIECGHKFQKKSNLQQHRRIHLGEKPFQCDVCGLTFTQKTHMKNHANTHSGVKPYRCSKCGQCFTRNADLNRHSKRAHENKSGNRGL